MTLKRHACCQPANQILYGSRSECSATERLICAIDNSGPPETGCPLTTRQPQRFGLEPLYITVEITLAAIVSG